MAFDFIVISRTLFSTLMESSLIGSKSFNKLKFPSEFEYLRPNNQNKEIRVYDMTYTSKSCSNTTY